MYIFWIPPIFLFKISILGDAWCYKKVCEEVLRLAAVTSKWKLAVKNESYIIWIHYIPFLYIVCVLSIPLGRSKFPPKAVHIFNGEGLQNPFGLDWHQYAYWQQIRFRHTAKNQYFLTAFLTRLLYYIFRNKINFVPFTKIGRVHKVTCIQKIRSRKVLYEFWLHVFKYIDIILCKTMWLCLVQNVLNLEANHS